MPPSLPDGTCPPDPAARPPRPQPGVPPRAPGDPPARARDPRAADGVGFPAACGEAARPRHMTGLLVDFLCHFFARPAAGEEPNARADELRDLAWEPGPQSPLLVCAHYAWDPAQAGKRPALVVKRNAVREHRLYVGDVERVDPWTGRRHCGTQWDGSHTVFCWHALGAGAEVLAFEVAQALREFAYPIAREFDLDTLQVQEVGDQVDVEEMKGGYAVPVTVRWATQHRWALTPEARRLAGVLVDVVPPVG